jgi:putative endonuclease
MYYVYILFSEADRKLYTGFCDNLRARFEKHQNGYVKSTKHRRPLRLIYYEAYVNRIDARKRETHLKGGKEKSELKIQLNNILSKLE